MRHAPQAEEIDDEPPLDDGLPADHPRCALCHRCANPVLALPAPASPSAAVTTTTVATTAAVTSALAGAEEPVGPADAPERVPLLTETSMAVDEPAEQLVVAAAAVGAGAGAADGMDLIARASRSRAPTAAQEGGAAMDIVMGEAVAQDGVTQAEHHAQGERAAAGVLCHKSLADRQHNALPPGGEESGPAVDAGAGVPAQGGARPLSLSLSMVEGELPPPTHDVMVKTEELAKMAVPREQSGDLPVLVSTATAPAAPAAAVAAAGEVVAASCTVRQAGGCGLGPLVPVKGGSLPAPCLVHSQCALWSPDVFVIGGSMVGGWGPARNTGQSCFSLL